MRHTHLTITSLIALLLLTLHVSPVHAQECMVESEPNETPARAIEINGATCVTGQAEDGNQDLFAWIVSQTDAAQPWIFTLKSIPDALTNVEIVRVIIADNGTDIAESTRLYTFGTPDGETVRVEGLLLLPGTYYIGVVAAGGTGDYQLDIQAGDPFPASADIEPNEEASNASPLPAFDDTTGVTVSGDLQSNDDYYAWTLSETDTTQRWHISAQLPLGEDGYLYLNDANGNQIVYQQVSTRGRVDLAALGLSTGDYRIRLTSGKEQSTPYILALQPDGERSPTHEEEPNDDGAHAMPIDPTQPIEGSLLADHYDIDFYKLTVDATFAAQQWELTALPSSRATYELCLLTLQNELLQCRKGNGDDTLPALSDLVLQPGEYLISLRNEEQIAADYTLEFVQTDEALSENESEPNDYVKQATLIGSENAIRGRFVGSDDDYYRFNVTGEAQLWRIQATGEGIEFLAFSEIDGYELVRTQTSNENRVRLEDIFLLPGDHFVRIRGTDGDYTIRVLPVGPPAESVEMPPIVISGSVGSETVDGETVELSPASSVPGAGITEREPNNSEDRAERLPFNTPRSGRLIDIGDRDVYRFYLAGNEQVRLIVVQPSDGLVEVDLANIFYNAVRSDGTSILYQTLLGPGDHYLVISAVQLSEEPYFVLLERLDPFNLPIDREPENYQRSGAIPLPATLTVSGTVNIAEDSADWYVLPAQTSATTMTIRLTPGFSLDVRSEEEYFAAQNADPANGIYPFAIPADTTIPINVGGYGAYTMSVELADGPAAQPIADPMPLEMALAAPVAAVAGYWEQGQQVDLSLTLTNTGDDDLALQIEAVRSDLTWQLAPITTAVSIVAGETLNIPLTLSILPDAGTDLPARISLRASNESGASVSTQLELPALCGVSPVNPTDSWTTAGKLLGGLNLAWLGLGSQPRNDLANERIFNLFDDLVSPVNGWNGQPEDRLTVELAGNLAGDLAGDEAVPVAGFILNPFGRSLSRNQLRHFEVLLSNDGQNFEVAYTGELVQSQLEQVFVLPKPVLATFAQLRLIDNWGDPGDIGLGEFKVVAAPEYQPVANFDLLDPALGGHVVSSSPLLSNMQDLVKRTDERPTVYHEDAALPVEWVVGFQHNRVAQITALHWRNPPDGEATQRFRQVAVHVSTDSPMGPWQALTDWTLDPASALTQTLTLDAPAWARFVRYIAKPPTVDGQPVSYYAYPDALGIDERPIDATYRSILAEWGGVRPQAIYEEMQTVHKLGSQISESEPNNDQATAQELAEDQPINGTVQIRVDEDWYKVSVPEGANTLTLRLEGAIDHQLLDTTGAIISSTLENLGGVTTLKAAVEPGSYLLRIFDPKRSIVFTWDTSGSVGPYLAPIYQSLARFTEEIDPQYEVVNLLPFGDPGSFLLDDFSGEPMAAQIAFNNYPRQESSSSAEANLLAASEALSGRSGARAIVLVTDAESGSYSETEKLWRSLATVRPRIFSFEISSSGNSYAQDLMQDWAMVNHGQYASMSTLGLFEQGFARTACHLRRPASYQVQVEYSNEAPPATPTPEPTATPTETPTPEPTVTPTETATPSATPTPAAPGSLRVIGKASEAGQPAAVIGGGAVELILDASGSMLQLLEGRTRIKVARDTLTNLTSNVLPPGTQIALRVFGHIEAGSCRTDLEIPLQRLDAAVVNQVIAGITAKNLAKTPIGESLRLVAQDLAGATGQKVVVLVTDGEETCGSDPAAEIANLRAQGIDVRVNIVGFAVNDPALEATFQSWAELGGGSFFNADNAAELDNAVSNALSAPFRVLDASDNELARGTVNGEPVNLPAGEYSVEVLTEPIQTLSVVVGGGENVEVEVEHNPDS